MIKERIAQYLDSKGISKYKFYKTMGLSNGYLDNKGAILTDILDKICAIYVDLNLVWLVTGNGNMIIDPEVKEKHYEDHVQGKHENLVEENNKPMIKETNVDYKEKYYATLERLNECLESKDALRSGYKQTRVDITPSNTPKLNVKE